MKNNNHLPVVVGVDGSAESRAALRYAAWEADRRRVPLRVVHGLMYPPAYGFTAMPGSYMRLMMTDARTMVQQLAATLVTGYPELTVAPTVVVGGPANVLINESKDAGLVVVGTRGQGGFAHLVLGSVSSQVTAHAHAPVIVVPPAVDEPTSGSMVPGAVVVGVDGSAPSMAAVEFAAEEAAARQVPLIAVYVWQNPLGHNLGPITVRHFDAQEAQQEADRMLAEVLAGWQEKYPDLTITPRAVHGVAPTRSLLREAAGAGLIVVGSQGHGVIVGTLLGSVSQGVLAEAGRPVAVVHR